MTCHAHITAGVADRSQYEALARHMDAAARASGPVGITSQTPNDGGKGSIIERRFHKLYPHNVLRRKRSIALHTALSRGA
ncbi:hypothetical protein SAMN04489858_12034 [Paracoccus homiensis]|uniref:Uncharacterized protein n=1 Tax=Paracoccus homiensis TaxID=364199 RepID=A0A1I0J165_9RHOB|nr:hypothetical protein SAMN04489858_12034 [Paracoccus homiensis]